MKKGAESMQVYGIDAIIRIVSHLAFIYLAFWALQSVRIDAFLKPYERLRYEWSWCFLRLH